MATQQDGSPLDQAFYDRGFADGRAGLPEIPGPGTIDQLMSYEDGWNAGDYEYRQAHGGEPEGAGGGVG
jgi:hypothetical protein